MALKIDLPTEKVLKLIKADPTGEAFVTIRQARQAQHEKRGELFAEASRVWTEGNDQFELKQKVSMEEVRRTEVELTIADCNIEGPDGEPLFKFATNSNNTKRLAMNSLAFAKAWGLLPPEVANEIHEKVVEVNLQWGPDGGK